MQPSQQPPMGAPYYGPQPAPAGPTMPIDISRKLVFIVVALGVLLMWIGALGLNSFGITDPGALRAFLALAYTGAAVAVFGCVLGALGAPRATDFQRLGLLILAGFFLMAASIWT